MKDWLIRIKHDKNFAKIFKLVVPDNWALLR